MPRIPKVIPPGSRVRLLRGENLTPSWKKDVGRRFRVGYYSAKDGLDFVWLVNEEGEYERTTDRKFLLKYFDVEWWSSERSLFGRGRRPLRRIRLPNPLERLKGRTRLESYEGAKEIGERDDQGMLPGVIHTLLHGKRVLNRAAAAYALNLTHGKAAVPALERVVANEREHPKVRGQAAESLAHNHRPHSHRLLRDHLSDASKEVRFWCAFSLGQMVDQDALVPLKELVERDHRVVRGFWSVSREASASIGIIKRALKERRRHHKQCLFCSKQRTKAGSRQSRA